MAQEIVESENSFKAGYLNKADEILENYSHRLTNYCRVYSVLAPADKKARPASNEPLKANEFRCFQCGGVIRPEDDRCKKCGWSWELET